MIRPCLFGGPPHEYPDDWIFGGADGQHPGADPRCPVNNYEYIDSRLKVCWQTSTPLCDDEAIDRFTWVASLGPGFDPVWLRVRRQDGSIETFKLTYNKATDTVTEVISA